MCHNGEKCHLYIIETYIQNKLDTQRLKVLLKLFTDTPKTTLRSYLVSHFLERCYHVGNSV